MSDQELPMRTIKSFVLRGGRMTDGQEKAFANHWQVYGVEPDQALDAAKLFGRDAPVVLEIGYGMGLSLVEMASQEPDKDFVGIEVHRPGVAKLLMEAERSGLTNLKSYCFDAVEILNQQIANGSLSRVQIYFPDPWHKKKHNKRRLIQIAFVELLASKLKPNGVLHMATDWEPYAEHMVEVMAASPQFENTAQDGVFAARPEWRPLTKFEQRGQRLGHGVWDLVFRKAD